MRYALLIQGSPYSTKACHSAWTFANTIISSKEHDLAGVFFYQDSVLIGNQLTQVTRDEFNIQSAWQTLNQTSDTPLYLCIAAAVSRGIISHEESQRYELTQYSLATGFQLEGLGSFVALTNDCDRLICFK